MSGSNEVKTIKLLVQGPANVPSFKNNKMLAKGRLFTNPRNQKWMKQCTDNLESALRCWFLINETGTAMECIPLSKIVLSLPLEDSLKWIGSHSVNWRRVKKGEEGFEITIEKL